MKLIAGEWKELGSMRIMPIQKVGAHTTSIPLDMNVVGHQNTADQLNLVVLQIIPIERNDKFEVEVNHMTMNADAHTHQSAFAFHHLPSSTLLL